MYAYIRKRMAAHREQAEKLTRKNGSLSPPVFSIGPSEGIGVQAITEEMKQAKGSYQGTTERKMTSLQ